MNVKIVRDVLTKKNVLKPKIIRNYMYPKSLKYAQNTGRKSERGFRPIFYPKRKEYCSMSKI